MAQAVLVGISVSILRCSQATSQIQSAWSFLPAWKFWCAFQVLPKGYGGQAEMILLQDYVKQHILPKQQVQTLLCLPYCTPIALIAREAFFKAVLQAAQTA